MTVNKSGIYYGVDSLLQRVRGGSEVLLRVVAQKMTLQRTLTTTDGNTGEHARRAMSHIQLV